MTNLSLIIDSPGRAIYYFASSIGIALQFFENGARSLALSLPLPCYACAMHALFHHLFVLKWILLYTFGKLGCAEYLPCERNQQFSGLIVLRVCDR